MMESQLMYGPFMHTACHRSF